MNDPRDVVTDFLSAMDSLDIDRALSFLDNDIEYQNVPLPAARGHAAVEEQLRRVARICTGFEGRVRHIAVDGDVVLTERTDTLQIRSWEAKFWVFGSFQVRDGRIVVWRDYFDWTTVFAASAMGAGRSAVHAVRGLLGRLSGGR